MKIKFNLYISSPVDFAKNPSNANAYYLDHGDCRHMDDTWTFVSEIYVDVDVDMDAVIGLAKDELDVSIGKHTAAITVLESRKNELLALTHEKAA